MKVIDGGSKYGIFINDDIYTDIPIPKNEPTELYAGDKIRFGRLKNWWRLDTVPIVTISSTLSATEKIDLLKDISVLNGTCLNNWDSTCNYITCVNVLITIKVLQALSAAIPIVTPNFWKAYITAIRSKSTTPTPDNFLPPILEPHLPADVSFLPNINRKRLFAGKTLVFMIRGHKEKFLEIIKLAGGIAISLDDNKVPKRILIGADTIVIQYIPSTQSQTTHDINDVSEYIRKKGLRTIPDSEIGLAIVHCSIVKFCNPKFKLDADFVTNTPHAALQSTSKFLAESTPADELFKMPMNLEVGETFESDSSTRIARNDGVPNVELKETTRPTRSNCKRTASAPAADAPLTKKKNTTSPVIADKENFSVNAKSMEASKERSQSFEQSQSFGCIDIDDDDDDALLASMEMPVIEPDVIKPITDTLPSSSNQGRTQIDNFGFITTNRNRKTSVPPMNVTAPTANRKRVHDLLNADGSSGDESDDNLFKFTKATKMTKSTECNVAMPQEEHDTLFMFSTPASSQQVPKKQPAAVQPSTAVSATVARMDSNIFNLSRIKPIPITIDGWLSKDTIKKEVSEIKTELNTTNDPAEHKQIDENKVWIESLQNVFVTKFKEMNLVNRTLIQSGATAGGSNAKNVKNFKTFIKVSLNFTKNRNKIFY